MTYALAIAAVLVALMFSALPIAIGHLAAGVARRLQRKRRI